MNNNMDDGVKFFLMFSIFIISLFFVNYPIIVCCLFTLILLLFIWFLIPYFNFNIKQCIINKRKYHLKENEIQLWENIKQKANNGYKEFCDKCMGDPDYWGWPWMSPNLTMEERELLNKIHAIYFGKDYYITDAISVTQGDWAFYDDIKDKVK